MFKICFKPMIPISYCQYRMGEKPSHPGILIKHSDSNNAVFLRLSNSSGLMQTILTKEEAMRLAEDLARAAEELPDEQN